MQIMHEQLITKDHNSVMAKWDQFPHFTFPWHYHKEIEIVYVIKSYGNRYVGDSVELFSDGDLVLLGSNLPHYWKNHNDFYKGDPTLEVNAIVIQFSGDIFKNSNLPEFKNIIKLIDRSERGIQLLGSTRAKIGSMLFDILKLDGINRYVKLIETLNIIAHSRHYRFLGSPDTRHSLPKGIDSRLEKILSFINNNFTETHSLDYFGKLIGMNKSAFCRYFKTKTGKTIIEYIHDMRIGYACKLLTDNSMTTSEIAFECGFNNISNFNRVFKRKVKITPTTYQLKIKGEK
ncbi:MAG: AraC family transcriptional regulator [Marinilabiliaceae bacterium]|nr:AraC family transcriptional regulator [Marinilabiliaceae bacterium]